MSLIAVEELKGTEVALHVLCDGGCGQSYTLIVREADYARYLERSELIQNIFPYLAPPQRELLISGICLRCWKQPFGTCDTSAESSPAEDDV